MPFECCKKQWLPGEHETWADPPSGSATLEPGLCSSSLPVQSWNQGVGAAYQTYGGLWCGWKHKHRFEPSRNSLFVPFSHSLSCLLNVYAFKGTAACTGGTGAKEASRGAWPEEVAERPSGFLFLRFGIDLLTVQEEISEEQLPDVLLADNWPAASHSLTDETGFAFKNRNQKEI